jgi:hypothetical protein
MKLPKLPLAPLEKQHGWKQLERKLLKDQTVELQREFSLGLQELLLMHQIKQSLWR